MTPAAAACGLVDSERKATLDAKEEAIHRAKKLLDTHQIDGVSMTKYLRRNEVEWGDLVASLPSLADFPTNVVQQVTYDVRYAGYIDRQQQEIVREQRLAGKRIPASFEYDKILPLCRGKGKTLQSASLDIGSGKPDKRHHPRRHRAALSSLRESAPKCFAIGERLGGFLRTPTPHRRKKTLSWPGLQRLCLVSIR